MYLHIMKERHQVAKVEKRHLCKMEIFSFPTFKIADDTAVVGLIVRKLAVPLKLKNLIPSSPPLKVSKTHADSFQ